MLFGASLFYSVQPHGLFLPEPHPKGLPQTIAAGPFLGIDRLAASTRYSELRTLIEGDVDGHAAFAADPSQFEQPDNAVAVFRRDRQGADAEDGVADVRVKLAIIARNRRVAGAGEVGGVGWIGGVGEGTPVGFGFGEPGGG